MTSGMVSILGLARATSSSSAWRRPATITWLPSRWKALARARPIPEVPPVIKRVFASASWFVCLASISGRGSGAPREDPLDLRPDAASPLPGHRGRGRSDLHRRRARLNLRGHDRGVGHGPEHGREDLGAKLARSVANRLVMPQRRSGGRSQHSELLSLAPKSDRIQRALDHAPVPRPPPERRAAGGGGAPEPEAMHPAVHRRDGTVPQGCGGPEAARLMIEQSRHGLEVVAKKTGFRDCRHIEGSLHPGLRRPPPASRVPGRAVCRLRSGVAGRLLSGERPSPGGERRLRVAVRPDGRAALRGPGRRRGLAPCRRRFADAWVGSKTRSQRDSRRRLSLETGPGSVRRPFLRNRSRHL